MWGIVDEEFRITPTLQKTMDAKQKELDATKAQNVDLAAENQKLKQTLATIQNTAVV